MRRLRIILPILLLILWCVYNIKLLWNNDKLMTEKIIELVAVVNSRLNTGWVVEVWERYDVWWNVLDWYTFCVNKVVSQEWNNVNLEWFYVLDEWLENSIITVADGWLEEYAGGFWCLVANVRIWYCTNIDVWPKDKNRHVTMWECNIQSEYSDKLLEDNMNRGWEYVYCKDIPETWKYNQDWRIDNVLKQYYWGKF